MNFSITKRKFRRLSIEMPFLLGTSFLVVSARILGALFGIASQVLIARLLGAEALGLFFIAISVAAVLPIICTLGYPGVLARFVSRYEGAGRTGRLSAFLAFVNRDTWMACVLVLGPATALILLWPQLSEALRYSLLIGTATSAVVAFMKINGAFANAKKLFMLAYMPDLFWRPLLLLLAVATLWSLSGKIALIQLLVINFLIVMGLWAFQALRIKQISLRERPEKTTQAVLSRDHPGLKIRRKWRMFSLPMIVAALFVKVFSDLDILIVGTLMPERELAIFGVSLKIALFLAFSIQAVHQLILRDAADALHSGNRVLLRQIIGWANLLSIGVSLCALLAVILGGRFILGFFGEEFTEGYLCLVVLVFAQFLRSIAGPAIQILTLTGQQRHGLPIFAVSLLLLVIFNLLLVPYFHLLGAALSVLAVTVIWSGGLAVVARSRAGVSTTGLPSQFWFPTWIFGRASMKPAED